MAVPLCARAARLRPRGAKGTGTSEPADQTPRLKGAPRSGTELHKRSAEASRVEPAAGPVILTHRRGRCGPPGGSALRARCEEEETHVQAAQPGNARRAGALPEAGAQHLTPRGA